jgi:hypothetical protein
MKVYSHLLGNTFPSKCEPPQRIGLLSTFDAFEKLEKNWQITLVKNVKYNHGTQAAVETSICKLVY